MDPIEISYFYRLNFGDENQLISFLTPEEKKKIGNSSLIDGIILVYLWLKCQMINPKALLDKQFCQSTQDSTVHT